MANVTPAAIVKTWKCFDGRLLRFKHDSSVLKCSMQFHVYEPPASSRNNGNAPVMYFLSGLTCTDENFPTKSGSQRYAAEHGIAIVNPDTSPRGTPLDTLSTSWDFGAGAGFYVDATQEPWSAHYKMFTYVTVELPAVLQATVDAGLVALDLSRSSISGHSMGGLGALTCALRNPGKYKAVSAFAPIAHPSEAPWGIKAFTGYLGPDKAAWAAYDPTALAASYPADGPAMAVLIDQGDADEFLGQGQLRGQEFADAAASGSGKGVLTVTYNLRPGYDHGYYFVGTFLGDHIAYHARALKA